MRVGIRKIAAPYSSNFNQAATASVFSSPSARRVSCLSATRSLSKQVLPPQPSTYHRAPLCFSPFHGSSTAMSSTTTPAVVSSVQSRACATQQQPSDPTTTADAFLATLPADCRLPPITTLSNRVTRVMGMNPGPMTLGGTNTYLVGKGTEKVLIDTGDGLDSFIDVLKSHVALEGITITAIVLTHWHHDHVGGLRAVLEMFPEAKVIKGVSKVMPNDRLVRDAWSKSGDQTVLSQHKDGGDLLARTRVIADSLIIAPQNLSGRDVVHLGKGSGLIKASVESKPSSDSSENGSYHPHPPSTTMCVAKLVVDADTSLLFIPTPGHTDDHYSLLLKEEHAIFSGDCVLGTGSSVFVCYSDFMGSLGHLERIAPSIIYPGHGPMVTDGVGRINQFITHRLVRENQVLSFLWERGGASNPVTIMEVVQTVYADVPVKMHLAAAGNVLHILKRMMVEKKVSMVDYTVMENPTDEGVEQQKAYHDFLAEEEYHEVPDNGAASEGEGSAVDFKKMTTYVTLLKWYASRDQTATASTQK